MLKIIEKVYTIFNFIYIPFYLALIYQMELIINGNIFHITETNINKLKKASSLFSKESKQEEKHVTFNSVSCNEYLPIFFQFIDGTKREIAGNEWFKILDVAIEWKCNKDIIDSIFQSIIMQLTYINKFYDSFDTFINESAEKLPELIKYMSFMLIPTEIISKLFESRFACLPNQINIAKFVTQYFDIVGMSAISFVHYIDPKILPQLQLDALNKKFEEFNCSHLFPEFQIHVPRFNEIQYLTLQCTIAQNENRASFDRLKGLEAMKNDCNNFQKDIDRLNEEIMKKQNEIKKLSDERKIIEDNNKEFRKMAKMFDENKKALEKKKEEKDKCRNTRKEQDKKIKNSKIDIDQFRNKGIYVSMKKELNDLIADNKKNEKTIEENEALKEYFIKKRAEIEGKA